MYFAYICYQNYHGDACSLIERISAGSDREAWEKSYAVAKGYDCGYGPGEVYYVIHGRLTTRP